MTLPVPSSPSAACRAQKDRIHMKHVLVADLKKRPHQCLWQVQVHHEPHACRARHGSLMSVSSSVVSKAPCATLFYMGMTNLPCFARGV